MLDILSLAELQVGPGRGPVKPWYLDFAPAQLFGELFSERARTVVPLARARAMLHMEAQEGPLLVFTFDPETKAQIPEGLIPEGAVCRHIFEGSENPIRYTDLGRLLEQASVLVVDKKKEIALIVL